MKALFAFSILVLSAACAPVPSPTPLASEPPPATSPPTSTLSPIDTETPTPAGPPAPVFDVRIDTVATGPQGQIYASGYGATGDDLRRFAHWDGGAWKELGSGFSTAGHSLAVDSAGQLYTETLADSGQGTAAAILRWNGTAWEDLTGNFSQVVDALMPGRVSSNVPVAALAVDRNDNLYAAGSYYYPSADNGEELPMGYAAKWDGQSWTALGQGSDRVNFFALAVSPAGKVYVSGERVSPAEGISGYIAEWDGEKWTEIDAPGQETSLHLALDGSGGLYAAGQLGTTPGAFVRYWDGTTWTTITDQVRGEAPAVFALAASADGQLYAGGSFDSVSGVPARNIAVWDGSAWHALGDGTDKQVEALALGPDGQLYAVGLFSEAGGQPAPHAAHWDGEAWRPLGQ